jgi:hypothetical protein
LLPVSTKRLTDSFNGRISSPFGDCFESTVSVLRDNV